MAAEWVVMSLLDYCFAWFVVKRKMWRGHSMSALTAGDTQPYGWDEVGYVNIDNADPRTRTR